MPMVISMRGWLGALILALTPAIAVASDDGIMVFGAGTFSCAKWQDDNINLAAGNQWIEGFWTGIGLASKSGHQESDKIDPPGLFAEVKKECLDCAI